MNNCTFLIFFNINNINGGHKDSISSFLVVMNLQGFEGSIVIYFLERLDLNIFLPLFFKSWASFSISSILTVISSALTKSFLRTARTNSSFNFNSVGLDRHWLSEIILKKTNYSHSTLS